MEYQYNESKEKIPLDKVLDDMYNPNGGLVSLAARDYYYENYATNEEKHEMDREDKISDIILKCIMSIFIIAMVVLLIDALL